MVDGLNETGHADDGDDIVGLEFPDSVYTCEVPGQDPGSGLIGCANCEAGAVSYEVDITGLAIDIDADYYAVRVFVTGPKLQGSHAGCLQGPPADDWTPGQNICGPGYQRPMYDGEVSGWSSGILTFNAAPVAPTFAAEWDGTEANTCQTNWPDMRFPLAWLVNPDPVWPFPDSQGNLFGQCLFEYEQLPASIGLGITYFSHLEAQVGRWGVSVREYKIGETVAERPYTSYVWAA